MSIDEYFIDKSDIQLKDISRSQIENQEWFNFGFESVLNWKGDPVIVFFGGNGERMRDIHLFNCVTHELRRKTNVCMSESLYIYNILILYI